MSAVQDSTLHIRQRDACQPYGALPLPASAALPFRCTV